MNKYKAKQIILQAINQDAGELSLSSAGDKDKLTNADLKELMPYILRLEVLEVLDLSNNQLTKCDDQLVELEYLEQLDLSGNLLTSVDLGLFSLRFLKELDLRNNKLPFPQERLEAYGNPDRILEFASIKLFISKEVKKKATKLDLSSRNLNNADLKELLPDLLKLENLRSLNLRNNKLTSFNKELAKLNKLEVIELSKNKLTSFDKEFAKLENLAYLSLNSNRLKTFDKEFTRLRNLRGLNLRGNPLPFPQEILVDQTNTHKILNYIADYHRAKAAGNLRKLNEAKLVIIGESNVGKTCVINRLLDNSFIETDSTHGIQIRRWENIKLENRERVQMNVWDFGGQEIMHSTHQFFFTKRTVYILVVNARENEDANKTEEWLQRIQNLSQNSPVFIVGNKIDENNRGTDRTSLGYFDVERKRLLDKFPALIKGIYGISSDVNKKQYDFLFDEFKTALIWEIGKLKSIHDEFPENWFEVKADLETMQRDKIPYISFQSYITKCVKANIEKEESQRTLIEFMHDLGIALSFQEDKELRDLAVLNPEWVTRGVYALVDNAQITLEKGVLKREMIGSYLNSDEYPADTQDFIIKMMRKFRLLRDIQKDQTFLIPDLLPKDEIDTGSWKGALHFQYVYDIYEKSILRRLIVEMFHLKSENIYWRNGIVLQRGRNKALVKADVRDKTISVKIDGNPNTRREFMAIICNKFDEIHKRFEGLAVKEMLGHPKHPEIIRPYERLLKMETNNIEFEFVEEAEVNLRVKEWLNGFQSPEERQKRNKDDDGSNKFKIAEKLTITAENVNFTQQEKGRIQVNQSFEPRDIEKKMEAMFSTLNKTQKQDMEELAQEIVDFFSERLDKLNEEQRERFESLKNSGLKGKVKLAVPLIHHLGITAEIEKEIKPDEVISGIRKLLRYEEMTALNLLNS